MAGQLCKEELGSVLTQAMLAQKNIRPQHDLLQELRRRLQQQLRPSDDKIAAGFRGFALDVEHMNPALAAGLNDIAALRMDYLVSIKHVDLAPEICKVYFVGVRAGAHSIATCLDLAARSGARLSHAHAFASLPDEQLYDALVAQRLPDRPTTQTEAFSRVEAAFYALKLSREHYLPRSIEHLTSIKPTPVDGVPTDEDEDDLLDGATDTEHLAKTDLSDPVATGEPPQAAAKRIVDVEKARDYLARACTLWSLALDHIDLAVAVFSSFLDPKEVASLSDYTDRVAHDTALRTERIHSLPSFE